jgi:hypothetical protein
VEQELLTLPEHLSLPLVCIGARVDRSLVFYVIFCRSLFVLFSIGHCIVCPSVYCFGIFKLFLHLCIKSIDIIGDIIQWYYFFLILAQIIINLEQNIYNLEQNIFNLEQNIYNLEQTIFNLEQNIYNL